MRDGAAPFVGCIVGEVAMAPAVPPAQDQACHVPLARCQLALSNGPSSLGSEFTATDLEDLWWLLNQQFGMIEPCCTSMSWIWEAAMK